LGKPAAVRAVRAQAFLTPLHRRAEHSLGVIVRRLQAGHNGEAPQRLVQLKKILAKALAAVLRTTASSSPGQQLPHLLAKPLQALLQVMPSQIAPLEGMPVREQLLEQLQSTLAQAFGLPGRMLQKEAEVAFQMTPADLTLAGGQQIVEAKAIGTQHALQLLA